MEYLIVLIFIVSNMVGQDNAAPTAQTSLRTDDLDLKGPPLIRVWVSMATQTEPPTDDRLLTWKHQQVYFLWKMYVIMTEWTVSICLIQMLNNAGAAVHRCESSLTLNSSELCIDLWCNFPHWVQTMNHFFLASGASQVKQLTTKSEDQRSEMVPVMEELAVKYLWRPELELIYSATIHVIK